jgi:prophage maintenance system killer protein
MENLIEIYESEDGLTHVDVRFEHGTFWLSQRQMAELFMKDSDTIGLHLKNIYAEGELQEPATTEESSVVRKEGNRSVRRTVRHYNLDAVLSVGYRVNSKRGTQFRIWATERLKDYLVKGYAINETRLAQTKQEVKFLKSGIQILGRVIEDKASEVGLEWLQQYANGLKLLDDYDHEQLDSRGITLHKAIYPERQEYDIIIRNMKADFKSDIFGIEKDKGFESAIIQITKGYSDEDFYPSIEEKAAMLLYLITKNHAFTDGNKRIAAACFLLFLQKNNLLQNSHGDLLIANEALAGLTLFVAASKPEEMEMVKNLIVSILNRNK